jgi:hypothetical protein
MSGKKIGSHEIEFKGARRRIHHRVLKYQLSYFQILDQFSFYGETLPRRLDSSSTTLFTCLTVLGVPK